MSVVVDEEGIDQILEALAGRLQEVVTGRRTAFIGLRSRGDAVAERLVTLLAEDDTAELLLGRIDVSLYRDDLSRFSKAPNLLGTEIDFDLNDLHVILVDDVIYTGRTIRAALDALTDYGRPSKVELAVLVDRGYRELPIEPNYVGIQVASEQEDQVKVYLDHPDGKQVVELITKEN